MARTDTETKGRTALQAWIAEGGGGSRSRLAERVNVSRELVSQWLSGVCRPGPIYRDALEVVAGIDPRDWETEAEREKRRRAITGLDQDPAKGAA